MIKCSHNVKQIRGNHKMSTRGSVAYGRWFDKLLEIVILMAT